MRDKLVRTLYPISWLSESPALVDFLKNSFNQGRDSILIADFASGEHDRVPSFFIRILPKLVDVSPLYVNTLVYCIDLHDLRLDSLLGKLEEAELLNKTRTVKAKLESMDEEASFRPDMVEYLENHSDDMMWLDHFLICENKLPAECFDIGILNNDIVGYMMEYYTEYSDALLGLSKIHKLMKSDSLLFVTMPCSLYQVDNIARLHDVGFEYVEGIDVDLKTNQISSFEASQDPQTFSRFGHYTFLVFKKN